MAISVDASVARWTGTPSGGGTAVSGSFTPANGSLLVCCINADESPGPNVVTPSGGGLTWTQRVTRGKAQSGEGVAAIWTAPVGTGASMTVTLTRTSGDVGSARRVSGKVYIVTGQHASPIGNSNSADWSSNPQTLSITAAGAGRLFGCGTDWNQTGTPVSTDVEDGADYAGQISVMSAYKSADHASGSQSIQFDPAGAPSGNLVVLEILAAASSTNYTLDADSGSFTLSGTAAGLQAGRQVVAASGSFTLTGTAAGLQKGYVLDAASGTFALTGTDVSLERTRVLTVDSGSYSLSGTAASLLADRVIDAGSGSFTLTGTDASLEADRVLAADSGSYTLTGTDVSLEYTPNAGAYVLDAESGTFTLTGADADLVYDSRQQEVTGGGWALFIRYEQERERRRRRKRKEEEAREALEQLPEVEKEIGAFLQKQEREDERRKDLERLKSLAREFPKTDLPKRVQSAIDRVNERQTISSLINLEKELRKLAEEEEIAILMLLLND